MLIAFVVSFLSAWLCIVLFMRIISRMGMWPFVAYRIVLGLGLMLADTTHIKLAVVAAGFQSLEKALALHLNVPVVKKSQ